MCLPMTTSDPDQSAIAAVRMYVCLYAHVRMYVYVCVCTQATASSPVPVRRRRGRASVPSEGYARKHV